MRDETPDSHHGGTSIVEFNAALLHFGGGIVLVPTKIEGIVAVITDKFGLDAVDPDGFAVDNFGDRKKGAHLQENILAVGTLVEGGKGFQTVRNVLGARKANAGSGNQVTRHGKHGNATVLEFVLAENVKLFLVAVGNQTEGVKDSQLQKK